MKHFLLLTVCCLLLCKRCLAVEIDQLKDVTPSMNGELKQRLNTLMEGILETAASEKTVDYALVEGQAINAYVQDNGVLIVSEGALSLPEPLLVFMLCHEVQHIFKNHHSRQKKRGFLSGLGLFGLKLFVKGDFAEHIVNVGEGLHELSHSQYGQAQEQEADREAVRLLADLGYDPVQAIVYFQTLSPASESKDILGSHPTFKARISDVARILPEIDWQPAGSSSSKSILITEPEYLDQQHSFQGVLDGYLTRQVCQYVDAAHLGLPLDPVGIRSLQPLVVSNLKAEETSQYTLVVRRYTPVVSLTAIESDVLEVLAQHLQSSAAFRAYALASAVDLYGNRQVAILLLKVPSGYR